MEDEGEADVEMLSDEDDAAGAALEEQENFSKEEDLSSDVEYETIANLERTAQLDAKTRALAAALNTKNADELLAAVESMRRVMSSKEGGDVLQNYILASPKFSELDAAWEAGPGSVVSVPLLQLLSDILRHPVGKVNVPGTAGSSTGDAGRESEQGKTRITIRLRLDKLASSIIRTRMRALYSHLTSSQRSRQNAALILLTGIVCRGRLLAVEVAKNFDFSLEALRKLARPPWLPAGKMLLENQSSPVLQPTRLAFIEFAISFLTMGDPGLVRWILLKRPLYAGVLNFLARDDEATILRVLKTLQKKVIDPSALVPPGILSSVFGDAALDQLAQIVANNHFEEAAAQAYQILLQFCTHPAHGLNAEKLESVGTRSFGSGHSKILRLLLQLKPTMLDRHKDLLLAIANSSPKLAAAYLDSLPFALQPRVSSSWFSAMSIVTRLVPRASEPPPFSSFAEQGLPPPPLDGLMLQSCIRNLIPRALPRGALNKGLQHADVLVKLSSLKLILVTLESAERLLSAILDAVKASSAGENLNHKRSDADHSGIMTPSVSFASFPSLQSVPDYREENDRGQLFGTPTSKELGGSSMRGQWIRMAQCVQDSLRGLLPDPQILLGLLSSGKDIDGDGGLLVTNKKRKLHADNNTWIDGSKKQRVHEIAERHDVTLELPDDVSSDEGDGINELETKDSILEESNLLNSEDLLYEKILEALSAYQRVLPVSLADNHFDPFKLLPDAANLLSCAQQRALLALLMSATDFEFGDSSDSEKVLWVDRPRSGPIFKHLKSLLQLMVSTDMDDIRENARKLASRAMMSSGAFDSKSDEVWLLLDLIPHKLNVEIKTNMKAVRDLHSLFTDAVVVLLSDAVCAVGQNIYKYVDELQRAMAADAVADAMKPFPAQNRGGRGRRAREFGPFVPALLAVWQGSKALTVSQRAATAMYVASILTNLLFSQAYSRPLAVLIYSVLHYENKDQNLKSKGSPSFRAREWIPLKQLLSTARGIIHKGNAGNSSPDDGELCINGGVIEDVFRSRKHEEPNASDIANDILLSKPEEMVEHFPSLLETMAKFCPSDFSILFFHFSVHKSLLLNVANTWPDMFQGCLVLLGSAVEETSTIEDSNPLSASTTALAKLIKQLPFHIIFPASASNSMLLSSTSFISHLAEKISSLIPSRWLFSAKVIMSSIAELAAMEITTGACGCIQICFMFLKQMIVQFKPSDFFTTQGNDAFERIAGYGNLISGILGHPIFLEFLTCQHSNSLLAMELSESGLNIHKGHSLGIEMERLIDCSDDIKSELVSGRRKVKLGDYFLLELLVEILEKCQPCDKNSGSQSRRHLNHLRQMMIISCQPYILSAVTAFQVQLCGSKGLKNLLGSPSFSVMSALLPYVKPDILVDMLFSLFFGTSEGGYTPLPITPSQEPPTLYGAMLIFHALSLVSVKWTSHSQPLTSEQNVLDGDKLEKLVYTLEAVVGMVMRTGSELGDNCILFAVKALESSGKPKAMPTLSHAASLVPLELLWYCIQHPTRTKSQILGRLMNDSPVFTDMFGWAIADAISDEEHMLLDQIDMHTAAAVMRTQSTHLKKMSALSDDSLMLLLSPAVIYLTNEVKKGEMFTTSAIPKRVAQVYRRILMEIIEQWDRPNFLMEQTASHLLSTGCDNEPEENTQGVFYSSTLGMIVRMFHFSQSLETASLSETKSLSRRMLSANDSFLRTLGSPGFLGSETEKCQGAAETVARVAILGELLAPTSIEMALPIPGLSLSGTSVSTPEQGSQRTRRRSKIRKLVKFMSFMVDALDIFFKLSTKDFNKSQETETSSTRWFCYTEETLLRSSLDVTKSVDISAWSSDFVSLVKALFTLVLRYRFTNFSALQSLRSFTEFLMEGAGQQGSMVVAGLSSDVLDLILSHSQFIPSLVSVKNRGALPFHVSAYAARSTVLSSLPFLLGLVGSPGSSSSDMEKNLQTKEDIKVKKWTNGGQIFDQDGRLEMVKLLRVLLAIKMDPNSGRNTEEDVVTLHELLSLLLAAYGATMSPVDQEIFNLMHEVELYGGAGFCGLSGMNYLWGQAAGKRRKLKAEEKQGTSLDGIQGDEVHFEMQKRSFKDDWDIDPKRCGLTVLCFPIRRRLWAASLGTRVKEKKGVAQSGLSQIFDPSDELLAEAAYDPAFILPFAAHSLVKGYLGPEEFVRLGLLAVSFASISSADDAMRRLGYDILTKYMKALEDGPRFKGSQQIQVLLSSVKNAITDPWQRIPFVSAVFAAEASCVLMHPEGVHYLAVNRFLLQGPSLDVEHVPLLHRMLGSGEPQFRNERAWILRLLAAGLVSSLDARIYRRRFILEILMSLYSSPLSDLFTRKWVLQVLKKASRVRSCAHHMVEHLGALSWLSSAAVGNELDVGGQDQQEALDIPIMCLEVLESVLRWKTVQEYGAAEGFDELVKIALQLHQHLVTKTGSPRERLVFKRPALRIITSVIRLSQRRKKHQTKLRFPFKFLVDIVDWVEQADGAGYEVAGGTRVLALLLLLQSPPPPVSCHEDRVMLLAVASWAVPIASAQASYLEVGWDQETMPEKLLRWILAALVSGLTRNTSLASIAGQESFWSLFANVSGGSPSRATCYELAKLLMMLYGRCIREASNVSLEVVVNALVMLLPAAGVRLSDPDSPKAIQQTFQVLLTDLPPPAEITSSWHWSYMRRSINSSGEAEAEKVRSAYMHELRSVLLVSCQQLLVASSPSFQRHLVDRWRKGLQSFSLSSSSGGSKLQEKTIFLRDKLVAAVQSV